MQILTITISCMVGIGTDSTTGIAEWPKQLMDNGVLWYTVKLLPELVHCHYSTIYQKFLH